MRLFLAVALPPAVKRHATELQRSLESRLRGWRWVRPQGLHLTLRFLGEVDPQRDSAARDAWRSVAASHRPFEVVPRALGRFPPRGRPRVLWLEIEERPESELALPRLAAALEAAARVEGFAARPVLFERI